MPMANSLENTPDTWLRMPQLRSAMESFSRNSRRRDHAAYASSAAISRKKNGMEKRMMPMGERGGGRGVSGWK